MDQDFYIEETSPVKIIFIILLFIALIAGGIYFFLSQSHKVVIKLKNVTVELGTKLPQDNSYYLTGDNLNNYIIDLSSVSVDDNGNVNSTGEYSYLVKVNDEYKKGKIYVKDTTKPKVEVEEITVGVNEEFMPNDFIKSCEDLSLPCTATYKSTNDETLNKKEGIYEVTLIVSDSEGNEVETKTKLNVSSNETLLAKKESDLTFNHLSEEDNNWNKTYTLKLDKAVADESARFNEIMEKVANQTYNLDKELSEKVILVVYNKYNYAIGFSVRITFTDKSVKYMLPSDIKESEQSE